MAYEQRAADRTESAAARTEGRGGGLTLEGRRRLMIRGVEEVQSFDEGEIALRTADGPLTVRGEGLRLGALRPEGGDVTVEGRVTELRWDEEKPERSFWARLFH